MMIDLTLFSADKDIHFVREIQTQSAESGSICSDTPRREDVVEALRSVKTLYVVSSNPQAAMRHFASQFTPVEAAGGVVEHCGKVLMIYRNGLWDLPKGHLESGESLAGCAAREVSEECGLSLGDIAVERHIVDTQHFYYFPKTARWELKTTHWYAMRYNPDTALVPQTDEGITRVEWISPEQAERNADKSYGTIRLVMKNY